MLKWNRLFSDKDFNSIEWETRLAKIVNKRGDTVFEQPGVEVPAFWSQTATDIVASKYFRGKLGSPERIQYQAND